MADLERALAFYRDVLGMRILWREEGMVMLRSGDDVDLALNQTPGPRPAGLHFGFKAVSIDEVERWYAHLTRRGISGITVNREPGRLQLYFPDPDGYTLEIYYPGA